MRLWACPRDKWATQRWDISISGQVALSTRSWPINRAVSSGSIGENPALLRAIDKARQSTGNIHLIGLLSDGGVHSHINHLKALCDILDVEKLKDIFVHAFTDGRDVDPKSGAGFVTDLQEHLQKSDIEVASVIGRYYAMDRDQRWERIKLAYDLLVHGKGEASHDIVASINASYKAGVTDEFIQPIVKVGSDNQPVAMIKPGDTVLFFNFRTDRPRQLTRALTQEDFEEWDMHALDLHFLTMTMYDKQFQNVDVMFRNDLIDNTLGAYLSSLGKTQLRIAETEKYPHVTYFFSGGREEPFDGETRVLVPSPKVATYDLQPEMSAEGITDAAIAHLSENHTDFICLNYANTDMVGHTGVFEAAVKATETVDSCLSRLATAALKHDYGIIIIADHGNSDTMINPDGSPNTAHTINPVPVIYLARHGQEFVVSHGKLADIAPTILSRLGIPIPNEMDGDILVKPVD